MRFQDSRPDKWAHSKPGMMGMTVIHEPKRCFCRQPDCEAVHTNSWVVYGATGLFLNAFNSEEQAWAYIQRLVGKPKHWEHSYDFALLA